MSCILDRYWFDTISSYPINYDHFSKNWTIEPFSPATSHVLSISCTSLINFCDYTWRHILSNFWFLFPSRYHKECTKPKKEKKCRKTSFLKDNLMSTDFNKRKKKNAFLPGIEDVEESITTQSNHQIALTAAFFTKTEEKLSLDYSPPAPRTFISLDFTTIKSLGYKTRQKLEVKSIGYKSNPDIKTMDWNLSRINNFLEWRSV